MLVTFTLPAPADAFAPGCFDSSIGKSAGFGPRGGPALSGVLAAVTVQAGGASAELTMDVPDDSQTTLALIELTGELTEKFGLAVQGCNCCRSGAL